MSQLADVIPCLVVKEVGEGIGELAFAVQGKADAGNQRQAVHPGHRGVDRHRHQRHYVGAAGVAADVMGFGVRGNQFLRRREYALVAHQRHRVVFAGVGSGDVVHPGGGHGGGHLPGVAGYDAVDAEALVVAQQHRDFVVILRRVQGNQAVALGVVHVDDVKGEALAQAGQHQPGAVHRVGETQEQGQVVGAGAAFVGGQHHKGFGGAHRVGFHRVVVELDFGHRRAGAADVAGRGVHQQILAGAI